MTLETKPIKGFEELYSIRNDGQVIAHRKMKGVCVMPERILKAGNNGKYRVVELSNNGSVTMKLIHRLVAEAFIPNPDNKKLVNHINGDKFDNRVENLEWATHTENAKHSWSNGLQKAQPKSKLLKPRKEEPEIMNNSIIKMLLISLLSKEMGSKEATTFVENLDKIERKVQLNAKNTRTRKSVTKLHD